MGLILVSSPSDIHSPVIQETQKYVREFNLFPTQTSIVSARGYVVTAKISIWFLLQSNLVLIVFSERGDGPRTASVGQTL